jgi:predicted phosphodiesterase
MKLGVITDIHEQSACLERVLDFAERLGCSDIACLGDIIGYDPDLYMNSKGSSASACVRLVRENCRWVVAGNHDREHPSVTSGLTDNDIDYLDSLPDSLIIEPGATRILLSHYLYPDFTGSSLAFVRRLNQMNLLHDYLIEKDLRLAFAGHDHPAGVGFGYPEAPGWTNRLRRAFHYMPFYRYELDGQLMVCLLPALATRSGRPGFSVWDTDNRTLDVIQLAP